MSDPRDARSPRVPIRRPMPHLIGARKVWTVDTPKTVVLTSPALYHCVTHYVAPRTLGCEQWLGWGPCPHCRDGWPLRMQHWLRAQDELQRYRPSLLAVSDGCLAGCERLDSADYDLSGLYVTFWRESGDRRGKMYGRIEARPRAAFLPPDEPILPELMRMWAAPARAYPTWEPRAYRPPPDRPTHGGVCGPEGDPETDGL